MTTKERIHAEIDTLSGEYLDELYAVVQKFVQSKQHPQKQSFMAKLKRIQIDAPQDFAANLDLYVSGEKCAESDFC
jgi:hypothetical protein